MDGRAIDQRVERVVAELIRYQRGELQEVPRYQVASGGRYGLHGGTADQDRVVLTLVSPPDDAVTVVGLGRRDALLQLLTEWGKERAPFDRSSHPPQRLRLGEVRYHFTAVGGHWLLGVAHPRGHTVLLARDEEQTLVLVGEGARFEIVLAAAVRELPQEIDLDRLMRRARGTPRSGGKRPRSPAAETPSEAPAKIAAAILREHARVLEGPQIPAAAASAIERVLEAAFADVALRAAHVEMPEAPDGKKPQPRRSIRCLPVILAAILHFALEFGVDLEGSGPSLFAVLQGHYPWLEVKELAFIRALNLLERVAGWLLRRSGNGRRLLTGKIRDPSSDEHRRMCAETSTGAGRRPPLLASVARDVAGRRRPGDAEAVADEVGDVQSGATEEVAADVVAAPAAATPGPPVEPVDSQAAAEVVAGPAAATPDPVEPSPKIAADIELAEPPATVAADDVAAPAAATPSPPAELFDLITPVFASTEPAAVRELDGDLLAWLGEERMRALQTDLRRLDPDDQVVALQLGVELASKMIAGDRRATAIILTWGSSPSTGSPDGEEEPAPLPASAGGGDMEDVSPEAEDPAQAEEDPDLVPQPPPEEHVRRDNDDPVVIDVDVDQGEADVHGAELDHTAGSRRIEGPKIDPADASPPIDSAPGEDPPVVVGRASTPPGGDSDTGDGIEAEVAPQGLPIDLDLVDRLLQDAPGPADPDGPLRELDTLLDAGRLDEAKWLLDRLAEELGRWRRPARAQLHLRAARLAHARSRGREVLEHLERAAAILPWDAQVLQMLAAACEELGEHPRAAAAYAALLLAWKRSPGAADSNAIAKVRRKLDQAAAVRIELIQASEPLPFTDEPLPVTDEPLPFTDDEPLPVTDEPLPVTDEPLPHPDHAPAPAHAAVNETGPPPTLSSITAALMLTLGPRPLPTRSDLPPEATPSRGQGSADDILEISPAPIQPRSPKTLTGTLGPRGPPIARAEFQPPISTSPSA